jgi:DNA-binding SARP family transcriptional activator
MALLQINLLGDFQTRSASGSLVTLHSKKSQALVAYLSTRPAQLVSRDKIATLLWGSTAQEQARQSLRQTLFGLRKELAVISEEQRILVEEGDQLGVDPELVETDSVRFQMLADDHSDGSLETAAELYEGDFLEGFSINEERFDQWVLAERERLHEIALKVHAELLEQQARAGQIDKAIATAQRSLRIDALQENVHRGLMRLYMQRGDLVSALQQYETCARLLKRELRVDPEQETRKLHQEILELRSSARLHVAGETPRQDRKPTILVVEDNQLNRELTNAVLRQAGYTVLLAKDGAEALLLLGKERVDLLLLDIDLPFIDGHTLLEAAHENGIDAPAIFISGMPGDEPEVKAFEIGAADFIRKPVKNSVLLMRIARVLKDSAIG